MEEFLEEDTINLDWVQGKKLNNEERDSLEGEVTLEELEKALKSSNLGSSSGWDGISYKVLVKYFDILGPLLVKVANEGIVSGELSETFRLGLIKLIPKKGNAEKIGDWRPITLLSCSYKLISGVVAQRLEKYMGKMIGRAQKGFQRSKNINSCTINIMDRMGGGAEGRKF